MGTVADMFDVPNMNFYATGGLAVANVDRTSVVTLNGNTSNVFSDSNNARGVDVRCRVGVDVQTGVVGQSGISGCGSSVTPPTHCQFSDNALSLTENILRIGINYHFNAW